MNYDVVIAAADLVEHSPIHYTYKGYHLKVFNHHTKPHQWKIYDQYHYFIIDNIPSFLDAVAYIQILKR